MSKYSVACKNVCECVDMQPLMCISYHFTQTMSCKLTFDERIRTVLLYGRDGATIRSVADQLNASSSKPLPISYSAVCKIIQRFKETGSVAFRY
jgi:hypothetical protein